jgi:competence protein ComFC
MFPLFIKIKEAIWDILFPALCLNCQKNLDDKNKYVCDNCLNSIKLNHTLFCPVCRARLAENKRICHTDSRYLLAAAGHYDDSILQKLIHYFKYKSFKNLAPVLGEIAVNYIRNLELKVKNFILVPIPLHRQRERQRGFNQAKLIAEIVAEKFNLELFDALKRIKNNKPQAKLKDNEERTKNMEGCFEINPHTKREWSPSANENFYSRYGVEVKNPVQGKNILLIDDVFTSGATMNEAVKVLKAHGAKKIIALVIAKA